jgi:energy-coupling factor transporter transmembrane protein EcfT
MISRDPVFGLGVSILAQALSKASGGAAAALARGANAAGKVSKIRYKKSGGGIMNQK